MGQRHLHPERELECEQQIKQRSRKLAKHESSLQAGFSDAQYRGPTSVHPSRNRQIPLNGWLPRKQNAVQAPPIAQHISAAAGYDEVMWSRITELSWDLRTVRRDLHRYPELAFKEKRTAAVVAGLLREWGIEVHEGIGRTGIVGVIANGNSDRAIGLRA